MKNLTTFTFEDEDIKTWLQDEILIIEVKQKAFEIVTDLTESAHLFDVLDLAEKSPEAKAVFVYTSPGCFGEEEYDIFLKKIFNMNKAHEGNPLSSIKDQSLRIRQINILNHFIARAMSFKKLLIIGLQGSVVTPFFGASLAVDLRFATPDMEFSLAHLKYGLHPTGALPLLLPKYTGLGLAKYLLYRGGKIKAAEALQLNLVNKIFSADFLESSLTEIKEILKTDVAVLNITKKLFLINEEELQKYFEFEAKRTVMN